MQRRPASFLRAASTAACLALASLPGAASVEIVELGSLPVELTSPLPAAALVAGTDAELAWRPLADFAQLAGTEEWEAFLSLDGGRRFPVRLTPHLDLQVRRFAFRVPDLPSDAVRLLLRFGDERHERAVRLSTPFRIVLPTATSPRFADRAPEPAFAPGEPALAGAAGVLAWMEGERDGSALRARRTAPGPALAPTEPALAAAANPSVSGDENDGPEHSAGATPATHPAAKHSAPRAAAVYSGPLRGFDILLLIQRLNE